MSIISPLNRREALGSLLALGAAAVAGPAFAADPFPSKPITLVLPFPPGGSFDPVFRALAQAASQDLGQPIVLMHKPGAGGVMGTAQLATMNEADGYTLAVMHNSVIRAPLVQRVSWDPLRDFTYVIGVAGLVTGITVAADAPWKSLRELIEDARKRPGIVSWGNVGAISINRIYAERLAKAAGVKFNMVPFKGGGESFQALIGRHLDVYGDPGFGAQVQGDVHFAALEALPRRADREGAGIRPRDRLAGGRGGAEEPGPEDRCAAASRLQQGRVGPRIPATARFLRHAAQRHQRRGLRGLRTRPVRARAEDAGGNRLQAGMRR